MAKDSRLELRLTKTEKHYLDRRARECGLSVAAWIRACLLEGFSPTLDQIPGETAEVQRCILCRRVQCRPNCPNHS